MSCLLTSGIAKGCRDNAGGLKRILLTNSENIVSVTPAIGATTDDGIITGITGSSASIFYEFVPNKMSSNWVENIQSNLQNGTIGYEQVVTLMFAKNEASKRNQIKLLGQAEVKAIVEDYNNKYFYLGEVNGLELSGGNSSSGTALTDMNGWNITLTGMENSPAREVTADIVEDLIVS
jgi:hypothetical protein